MKTGFLGNVKVLMTMKVKQKESREKTITSLPLSAAVGGRRRPHAAWSGGAQPELPQQTPWSPPRVPRQRPAAGKAPPRPALCLLHLLPVVGTPPPPGFFRHALLMTLGFFFFFFTPVPPLWSVLCAVCGGGHAPR